MRRKELKAKIRGQEAEIVSLKNEQEMWRKTVRENQDLHRYNAELAKETNKLKKQIREQTEADLFFTSAKICSKLLDGESKDKVKTLVEHRVEMQAALARQQAAGPPLYLAGAAPFATSIFGGLFR